MKTLHPAIHGGLLARRADATHMEEIQKHSIEPIDLVVCNLYPFEMVRGVLEVLGAQTSSLFPAPLPFQDRGLWQGL